MVAVTCFNIHLDGVQLMKHKRSGDIHCTNHDCAMICVCVSTYTLQGHVRMTCAKLAAASRIFPAGLSLL